LRLAWLLIYIYIYIYLEADRKEKCEEGIFAENNTSLLIQRKKLYSNRFTGMGKLSWPSVLVLLHIDDCNVVDGVECLWLPGSSYCFWSVILPNLH
jgi:hypothetical protein